MNYNTQNAKIVAITEKTLVVGIDVGSETHFARAFDWRGYEYSKKSFAFSNTESGFMSFQAWMLDLGKGMAKTVCFQEWSRQATTGLIWENFCRIMA